MAHTMETLPSSTEDLTQSLPDDLLASVLRGLQKTSPPSLAASRCVCKAWRAVVDAHRLLVDLPPHSLTGIFVHIDGERHEELLTKYFSPVKSPTNITAAFDYIDPECSTIKQHCNGLLLLDNHLQGPIHDKAWVLNPATRRWARLPPPPAMCTPGMEDVYKFFIEDIMHYHYQYLVFDPAVSPHYHVWLVKHVPPIPMPDSLHYMDDHVKEREWPPSTFVLLVFSSRTKRWEERPFARQGEAAGTIGYMLETPTHSQRFAAYWRGALYVHHHDFILRINLSSNKYQVIKLPKGFGRKYIYAMGHCLGKSENGVYYAQLGGHDGLGLRIWCLDDECGHISWILKCDFNLGPLLADFSCEHSETPSEQSYNRCSLLGFHPNQEVVFLHTPPGRVLAYHFDSSKMEGLGFLPVETQDYIFSSFPYTLCLTG